MTTKRSPARSTKRAIRRPRKLPAIHWGTAASITANCNRDGYTFGAIIQRLGDEWHVIGSRTRAPWMGEEPIESTSQGIDHAFAHHSHDNLGVYASLDGDEGACAAARKYLYEAPVPTELCDCEGTGYTPAGPDP